MKTALLYRVVSEKVGVSDSFSVLRSPSIDEPRHVLGNGMTLLGVQQMPPRSIQRCESLEGGGEAYLALDPPLRELLEAPLRAELGRRLDEYCAAVQGEAEREVARRFADIRTAAEREIERRCAVADYLSSGPWHLRMWRALIYKAPAFHSAPV